jgi:membrane-bound acyltransferase YfiQ involved in biofilm formation
MIFMMQISFIQNIHYSIYLLNIYILYNYIQYNLNKNQIQWECLV